MKSLFFIFVVTGLVIFSSAIGEAALRDGTVLYLAFNEGSGNVAKDLSGNGNDGEIIDQAKWVDGKFGKALQFDGKTAYVDILSSKSLSFSKAVTVEAWVKSNVDHASYTGLIRKGNHPSDRPNFFMLQIKPDGPGGADMVQLVYSHASNDNDYVDSVTSLDVGKWYHLAGVIDPAGGKMTLYFNGAPDIEKVIAGDDLKPDDNPLYVGRGHNGAIEIFNGSIDEVIIYNKALTENEIKEDMAGINLAVLSEGKLTTAWGSIKNQQ